ncbi:MAG: hypothetical protein ACLFUJ_05060 [Phycisphaerae bacterium]
MHETLKILMTEPVFAGAYQLQVRTIKVFHELAAEICGQACPVEEPDEATLSLERNFFSTFFLAVTERLVGFGGYMPLYGIVNQGLRAWLTSVDNILDNEYKEIFRFAGVSSGNRIRSAMTLLLADRVVQEFVAREYADLDILSEVSKITIRALAPTALATGHRKPKPSVILPAEAVAEEVHARKTIELFLAPLSLPTALEEIDPSALAYARAALTHFGQGCQILDDLRDMPEDVNARRHNFLVSLMFDAQPDAAGVVLDGMRSAPESTWQAWERFEGLSAQASRVATEHFGTCYENLDAFSKDLAIVPIEKMIRLLCDLIHVPAEVVLGQVKP